MIITKLSKLISKNVELLGLICQILIYSKHFLLMLPHRFVSMVFTNGMDVKGQNAFKYDNENEIMLAGVIETIREKRHDI